MKVQFVVTGRCEEIALHHSIAQLFPTLEFLRPIRLESFTSTPITDPPKSGVLDTAFKFAAKLVEKVDGDDQTLVVGVDDQEAEPNPERQIKLVCDSVRRVLDEPPAMKRRERLTAQVMERCSFHLLIPMVEAYFWATSQRWGERGQGRNRSSTPRAPTSSISRCSMSASLARLTPLTGTTGHVVARCDTATPSDTSSSSAAMAHPATPRIGRANTEPPRCKR